MRFSLASCVLLLGLVLVSSCNDAGSTSAAIDVQKDESAGAAAGPIPKDDEAEEADRPAEVNGAFLACAFMQSEAEMLAHVENQPDEPVEVGCGLYRAKKLIDINTLMLKATLFAGKKGVRSKLPEPSYSIMPRGKSDFHLIVKVPLRALSGTIQIDVKNKKNQKAAFRKALWLITSFAGKGGFNIGEDVSKQKKLAEEQQQANDGAVTSPWWEKFLVIAITVIGEEIKEISDADFGTRELKCDGGECKPWYPKPKPGFKPKPGADSNDDVFVPEDFTDAESDYLPPPSDSRDPPKDQQGQSKPNGEGTTGGEGTPGGGVSGDAMGGSTTGGGQQGSTTGGMQQGGASSGGTQQGSGSGGNQQGSGSGGTQQGSGSGSVSNPPAPMPPNSTANPAPTTPSSPSTPTSAPAPATPPPNAPPPASPPPPVAPPPVAAPPAATPPAPPAPASPPSSSGSGS